MHPLLGMRPPCTREQRRKGLQVGGLLGSQSRVSEQQASNTPLVLLQPSDSEVLQRFCLQVDLGIFLMPPAVNTHSLPAYNIVIAPLQLFRC